MLIIFLATLYYSFENPPDSRPRLPLDKLEWIPAVYVHSERSFDEVERFVEECSAKYCLDVVRLQFPLKEAFKSYLEQKDYIKTILVGIRRADPYGNELQYIQRTDHGWPDFLRVHPVLEWHYVEVWDFLRVLEIPYCVLYDQGYTSLGGTNNTAKNPFLETEQTDSAGNRMYRPAYDLTDDDKERLGRLQ